MRLAFLLPVLLSVAAPAHAERERESRYGPANPRPAIAAAAIPYDGPMLSWAGKRQASAPVAAEPQAFAPAPPIADRPSYQPARYALPPPPAATLRPALPPAPPPRRIATVDTDPPPARLAPAPRAAPLPDSLYGPSRASVVAAAVPTAPPPRQVAALNAPSSTGVVGARFYSVGREFGLTPDALPPAGPDRRVLITAGEAPPPPRDAAPLHGSADWLAAGARGDDQDDDDGDKDGRAKTRDKAL